MLKKFLSLLFIVVMVFSLIACGVGNSSSSNRQGTILTDRNFYNYLDLTVDVKGTEFIVNCKSKIVCLNLRM